MSNELEWNFADEDEAKTEIRAAVQYLLRGAKGSARAAIANEVVNLVRLVAAQGHDAELKLPDPFDDVPGG